MQASTKWWIALGAAVTAALVAVGIYEETKTSTSSVGSAGPQNFTAGQRYTAVVTCSGVAAQPTLPAGLSLQGASPSNGGGTWTLVFDCVTSGSYTLAAGCLVGVTGNVATPTGAKSPFPHGGPPVKIVYGGQGQGGGGQVATDQVVTLSTSAEGSAKAIAGQTLKMVAPGIVTGVQPSSAIEGAQAAISGNTAIVTLSGATAQILVFWHTGSISVSSVVNVA